MLTAFAGLVQNRRNAGVSFAVGVAILIAALPCCSQTSAPARLGMPYDWSHHYVVFSNSPSAEIVAAAQQDPRYWQQKIRMEPSPVAQRNGSVTEIVAISNREKGLVRRRKTVDWSVHLGGAGSTIAPGMYPAKYTFDVNAAPSCLNDYVVYALNVAGSASQATIVAYNLSLIHI